MKIGLPAYGLLLILLISCNEKNHCYECNCVDSVFQTGYPDSLKSLVLLRIDTIAGKECFEKSVPTDTLFAMKFWLGTGKKIFFHKRTYRCN